MWRVDGPSTEGRNKQPNLKAAVDLADFGNTELEITIALDYNSNNYAHFHEATMNCDRIHKLTSLWIAVATIQKAVDKRCKFNW